MSPAVVAFDVSVVSVAASVVDAVGAIAVLLLSLQLLLLQP